MPLHTPYPKYKGECLFIDQILKIDDGKIHLWANVEVPGGNELDLLIWDEVCGVFATEVKSVYLDAVLYLDAYSIEISGRRPGSAPYKQAATAKFGLMNFLANSNAELPYINSIVAWPLIDRSEAMARFSERVSAQFESALAREDLSSIDSFRKRLEVCAIRPVAGRGRQGVFEHSDAHLQSVSEQITGKAFQTSPTDSVTDTFVLAPESVQGSVYASAETSVIPWRTGYYEGTAPRSIWEILDDFTELLRCQAGSVSVASGFGMEDSLSSLEDWLTAHSRMESRVQVAIVGEFKSGKSSLINALVGKEVLYADHFEATQAPTRLVSGSSNSAIIVFESSHQCCTLDDYTALARSRGLGDAQEIHLEFETGLAFDLWDTPGLGSLTIAHSRRAESIVRGADLVVWTIDPQNVGSAREGAFLDRANELLLPLVVAISKVDTLEEDEIAEVVAWSKQKGWNAVLTSSLLNSDSGKPDMLANLSTTLEEYVNEPLKTREASIAAKEKELGEECTRMLDHLLKGLEREVGWCRRERTHLCIQGSHTVDRVLEECRQEVKSSAKAYLASKLPNLRTNNEPQKWLESELASFTKHQLPMVLDSINSHLAESLKAAWYKHFAEQINNIEDQFSHLSRSGNINPEDLDYIVAQRSQLGANWALIESSIDDATLRADQETGMLVLGAALLSAIAVASFIPLVIGGIFAVLFSESDRTRGLTTDDKRLLQESRLTRVEQDIDEIASQYASEIALLMRPAYESTIDKIVSRTLDELSERNHSGRSASCIAQLFEEVKKLEELTRAIKPQLPL